MCLEGSTVVLDYSDESGDESEDDIFSYSPQNYIKSSRENNEYKLLTLPDELLLEISSYLDFWDTYAYSGACRYLRRFGNALADELGVAE